ncbi:MAG: helix-turn-helix transcriptional regulator [Calothrix sp. FI2-JRJ7]|jgi:transcriptional regulator with XRE-family HTH domain|nr:helix-turn-helix transcriptional regulator [Calothrix sp. FI2-JRJ7]
MSDFTSHLQDLIKQAGIPSLKALGRNAGVSERQILRLRRGEVKEIRVSVLAKLSQALKVSVDELVTGFSESSGSELEVNTKNNENDLIKRITELEREYSFLQQQVEQQKEILKQEFQQESLQVLESLLVQFPTAARACQENPQLPAANILPLVLKPLERLQQHWGVEAIASVGEEVSYDPQLHHLLDGVAQPGQKVKIRYVGYRQGEKLLYRAKVSPV